MFLMSSDLGGGPRRKMLFAVVPVQTLAKYGNSNSYFCNPYKNDITNVAIGTHGLCYIRDVSPGCSSLYDAQLHSVRMEDL